MSAPGAALTRTGHLRPEFDLGRLGDELARAGYGEFLACFDPLAPDPVKWRAYRAQAPGSVRPLIDLFLLGGAVERERLPGGIGALVEGLTAAGLLVEDSDGTVRTPGLVVLLVFGHWIICQPPQANPTFYFGEDSVALLLRLSPGRAPSCLDLCAGPGIHAVHSAGFASHVTAVERDPAAAQLAVLNTRLNRVADRVEVLAGDLFQPVAGRRFDLISANPPMLPYPADLPTPAIGSGGDDGLQMTRRILEGLPDALSGGGRAHVVGITVSDGSARLLARRLRDEAREKGLKLICTVMSHIPMLPGGDYFGRLVATVAEIAGAPPDRVSSSYMQMLDRLGADHLCTYFLQVGLGNGELEVMDVSTSGESRLWYV